MKKIMLVAVAVAGLSTSACAQNSYTVQGTVVQSNPQYQNVTQRVPTQTCQIVDVPVYGNNNSGGTLGLNNHFDIGGAIIGGVIGNNVTKNLDHGGAAGAIIGGLLGNQIRRNNSQQIVGYRQEQRCNTNYSTQTQQQYSHSDIVVEVNGMQVNAQTRRKVKVGDTVNVQVTLQVQ